MRDKYGPLTQGKWTLLEEKKLSLNIKSISVIASSGFITRNGMSEKGRVTPRNFTTNSTLPRGLFVEFNNGNKRIFRIDDLPHILNDKTLGKMHYKGQPLFKMFSQRFVRPEGRDFLQMVLKAREGDEGAKSHLKGLPYPCFNETSEVQYKPEIYGSLPKLIPYYLDEIIAIRLKHISSVTKKLEKISFKVRSLESFRKANNFRQLSERLAMCEDLAFAMGLNYDLSEPGLKGTIPDVRSAIIKLVFPFTYETSWEGHPLSKTTHTSFVFYPKELDLPLSLEEVRGQPLKSLRSLLSLSEPGPV